MELEQTIERKDEEIGQLKKKLKKFDAQNQYPCSKCTKNFISSALLDNHILRKHPPVHETKDKDANLINTIKLELEIKTLKERLNVTEKELTEANRKMECKKCEWNAQRRFENVGIQSNFEEKEKDDIEKDAIAELLSNQMKHFEDWKRNEESRYRSEISELRSKLDETILAVIKQGSQKETPTPLPAPRTLTLSEKGVGTSKSVESLPERQTDDEVWKSRYQELEKMYEQHQARMTSTVTSIESTYREKFCELEESVKLLKEEKAKAQNFPVTRVEWPPKVPLSPKVFKTMFAQISSSDSSDDELNHQPVRIQGTKSPELVVKSPPKPEVRNFSGQKFVIRPKPKARPATDVRETAHDIFRARLAEFGIKESDKTLSKKEFDRIQGQLASKREELKQKDKNFFISRRKLQAKVDEIFHRKNDKKVKQVKEPAQMKLFCGTSSSLKPIESPFKPTHDKSKREHEEEVKPVDPKKSFRDDLERILERRAGPLQQHEIAQTPVPATRKKVLFDMNHLQEKKFEEIVEAKEDDSDFDISSFASDFEDIKG